MPIESGLTQTEHAEASLTSQCFGAATLTVKVTVVVMVTVSVTAGGPFSLPPAVELPVEVETVIPDELGSITTPSALLLLSFDEEVEEEEESEEEVVDSPPPPVSVVPTQ